MAAAARYWRMAGCIPRAASGPLAPGSITFYNGSTEVVGTFSCPATPISPGVYAQDDARAPGFALQWDMGTSQEVTEVRFAANPFFEVTLQYSGDALVWVTEQLLSLLPTGSVNVPLGLDLYSDKVELLLHAESLVDSSLRARTLTANGSAVVSTAQSKFGGSSFECGADKSYTTTLPAITGDFTAEFWAYFDVRGNYDTLINLGGGYPNGVLVRSSGASQVTFWVGGSPQTGTWMHEIGQWYHVALTRKDGTMRLFADGVLLASMSNGSTIPAGELRIGQSAHNSNEYLTGYIDEVRVTVGVARYTSNFTPASAPFSVAGTYTLTPLGPRTCVTTPERLAGFSPSLFSITSQGQMSLNPDDGGHYRIAGTVKEKGTPVNTPLKRRVQLYNQRSYRLIRETWSAESDGSYAFDWIRDGTYFVVSFDHTGTYRAVIADNLQATL